jgi:hypothetical protein
MDEVLGRLSLQHEGASIAVDGPLSDGRGRFWLATLRGGAHYRIDDETGTVTQLNGNFSIPMEAWEAA